MGTQATLEQVREAARLAQIDDFILSLPQGYDTKVGAMGSRFSGGERQRIAIAHAILKDAPILILDEATSAADPENQVEIDRAIENLCRGKTVLIVAHRLGCATRWRWWRITPSPAAELMRRCWNRILITAKPGPTTGRPGPSPIP